MTRIGSVASTTSPMQPVYLDGASAIPQAQRDEIMAKAAELGQEFGITSTGEQGLKDLANALREKLGLPTSNSLPSIQELGGLIKELGERGQNANPSSTSSASTGVSTEVQDAARTRFGHDFNAQAMQQMLWRMLSGTTSGS